MASSQILHFWSRLKMMVEDAAGKIGLLRKTAACEGRQFSSEGQPEGTAEYHVLKDFVTAYSADNAPRLLVFGDSVSLRVATDDRSSQSLGEILRDHYQDHVCLISGSGYHAGIFEYFGGVLAAMRGRPRLAILPINPRSFSPMWDLNPLYQFRPEAELLASFNANRPDYRLREAKIFSGADELLAPLVLSHEETITLSAFLELISVNPVAGSDEWRKRLKTIFQCHYMLPVSSLHRKIKSLASTRNILNRLGVAVYTYITPINYEAGLEYCGESFVQAVENNVSVIKQEMACVPSTQPNAAAISMFRLDDFSFRFGRDVFFTGHNATEHLRSEGRDFLAKCIIEAERSLLKAGYF